MLNEALDNFTTWNQYNESCLSRLLSLTEADYVVFIGFYYFFLPQSLKKYKVCHSLR